MTDQAPKLFEIRPDDRPQPAPLKYSEWHTPLFHPTAIVTVANDLPSNSHNANGYNESLADDHRGGECWKAGTYFGRIPDDYSAHVRDMLTINAAQGDPCVAYMVLGWEETLVVVPERMLAQYIEPGRYCRLHDMDKSLCHCHDDNDKTLEESYLQKEAAQ